MPCRAFLPRNLPNKAAVSSWHISRRDWPTRLKGVRSRVLFSGIWSNNVHPVPGWILLPICRPASSDVSIRDLLCSRPDDLLKMHGRVPVRSRRDNPDAEWENVIKRFHLQPCATACCFASQRPMSCRVLLQFKRLIVKAECLPRLPSWIVLPSRERNGDSLLGWTLLSFEHEVC